MARWVKLTENDGHGIYLNLDNAISIKELRNKKGSRIAFAVPSDSDAPVEVQESIAEILEILKRT